MDFFDYITEGRKSRKITSSKPFDAEVLKAAGAMPVPEIPNPASGKLLNTLERILGFTEEDAYYWQFYIWRMAQDEDFSIPELMQDIINAAEEHREFKGIGELNDVMQVLSDYLNHTPRWNFYGRCPNDLHRDLSTIDAPPRITLGSNALRMGYQQEQVQQMVDSMWRSAKVGRNDPCPCGSGKKYKHCCGKN